MSQKKIIVVFGATGAQGGGLAHAILNDKNSGFSVRAVTRDVSSDKAKELASLGAEVVAGDVDDMESLKAALAGAYGAYFVTFFWAHFSPEKEMSEAKNMAMAAKEAGLKHVIWSTLEDVRKYVPLEDDRIPTLNGKYKVPHFDGKGASDQYFIDAAVPVTFFGNLFLLGEPDLFWHGTKAWRGWKAIYYFSVGKQKNVRYGCRGHRQMCLWNI